MFQPDLRTVKTFEAVLEKTGKLITADSSLRLAINPSGKICLVYYPDKYIELGAEFLKVRASSTGEFLVLAKSSLYHEIAHWLFSPPKAQAWRSGLSWTEELVGRCLEDCRVETWFALSYKKSIDYFYLLYMSYIFPGFVLSKNLTDEIQMFLLTYGRKFLPKKLLKQSVKFSWVTRELRTLVDEYVRGQYPADAVRMRECIKKIAEILEKKIQDEQRQNSQAGQMSDVENAGPDKGQSTQGAAEKAQKKAIPKSEREEVQKVLDQGVEEQNKEIDKELEQEAKEEKKKQEKQPKRKARKKKQENDSAEGNGEDSEGDSGNEEDSEEAEEESEGEGQEGEGEVSERETDSEESDKSGEPSEDSEIGDADSEEFDDGEEESQDFDSEKESEETETGGTEGIGGDGEDNEADSSASEETDSTAGEDGETSEGLSPDKDCKMSPQKTSGVGGHADFDLSDLTKEIEERATDETLNEFKNQQKSYSRNEADEAEPGKHGVTGRLTTGEVSAKALRLTQFLKGMDSLDIQELRDKRRGSIDVSKLHKVKNSVRLFKRKMRTHGDVINIGILIDVSGSMGHWIPDVIDAARILYRAGAMCKHRVTVRAFGEGQQVLFQGFFRQSSRWKENTPVTVDSGNTLIYEALRDFAADFAEVKGKKILFIISDGHIATYFAEAYERLYAKGGRYRRRRRWNRARIVSLNDEGEIWEACMAGVIRDLKLAGVDIQFLSLSQYGGGLQPWIPVSQVIEADAKKDPNWFNNIVKEALKKARNK